MYDWSWNGLLHFNIIKQPLHLVLLSGSNPNCGLDSGEIPLFLLFQNPLFHSFLLVCHWLKSPKSQRRTELERSRSDVWVWTETKSFWGSLKRDLAHFSQSSYWNGRTASCRPHKYSVSTTDSNSPPWVLKWNGVTCLLQQQRHDSNPCSVSLLTLQ